MKLRVRMRKLMIAIHLVSIGLWMMAGGIILFGAILRLESWVQYMYAYLLNPAHMAALASGLVLIYFTKGRILGKPWFRMKALLLLASMLFMNLIIARAIQHADHTALFYLLSIYMLLLFAILYFSIKKPQRLLLKKEQDGKDLTLASYFYKKKKCVRL